MGLAWGGCNDWAPGGSKPLRRRPRDFPNATAAGSRQECFSFAECAQDPRHTLRSAPFSESGCAELDLNLPLNADGSVCSHLMVARQTRDSCRDRDAEGTYALLAVVEANIGRATVASVGCRRQRNNPVVTLRSWFQRPGDPVAPAG